MNTEIAVIGLGYVGLPISLLFASKGHGVLGLDIDSEKIRQIEQGQSYIRHIPAAKIGELVQNKSLSVSTDLSRVREVQAIIICVPTPLNKNREPDLSYILKTAEAIGPHLQRGALVVLESTTYPGTTEDELRHVLETRSGLKAGVDFHLGYSPEREDPGNPDSQVARIPKIVSGYTPACLEKVKAIYGLAIQNLIPVSNCRTAEATKLLENIFRSVNIALVNELKVTFMAMNIDIWEAINAAKTKPFGYMPFYPGPGLGGHCIPIDPFYLTWKAREYGQHTRFIEVAGEINTQMPHFVVSRLSIALNELRKPISGSKILILGLSYKQDVDDDRESPSYELMKLLEQLHAEVSYHDPYIPEVREGRSHGRWANRKSVKWNHETVSGFDAVIIATAHQSVNYQELVDWASCVVDTRNCLNGITPAKAKIWKA